MRLWRIIISPEAEQDIRDIYDYIVGTLLEPVIAKKQIGRILKSIHTLDTMPKRHPLYAKEPWHSRGLRYVNTGNYLVFYLPVEEKTEVVIFRVFYSGRNIEALLDEENLSR